MKKFLIAATVSIFLTGSIYAQDTSLETEDQKLSYSLGMMIGERVLKRYGDVDYDLLLEAMRAQQQGTPTRMTMEDAGATLEAFEKVAADQKIEESQAAGKIFLAQNAEREGVTITESGLQWEVLTEGEGEKPGLEDTVSVHYVGTLIDGTEFDSSVARGQPASFPLKGVIPGWTEGVQLMSVGSKYRFVIPPELAYGDKGAGQSIGPGETLVFEVELLEIKQ